MILSPGLLVRTKDYLRGSQQVLGARIQHEFIVFVTDGAGGMNQSLCSCLDAAQSVAGGKRKGGKKEGGIWAHFCIPGLESPGGKA